MAGKSNNARNKKSAQVAAAAVGVPRETVLAAEGTPVADVVLEESKKVEVDDTVAVEGEAVTAAVEAIEDGGVCAESQVKQGDLHLYPVSVKTHGGEKLELQLNPDDSVMDVRQFPVLSLAMIYLCIGKMDPSTNLFPSYVTAATKNDASEIDGLGFMDDITGSLGKLLTAPPKEIKP